MSKTTKNHRKEEKVNRRLTQNENKINATIQKVDNLRKDYDEHILQHIKDDLGAETFAGSGRPLYTYEHIADRHKTSASTIGRIAEQNGLNRRGNKLS